jgi:hypothetical protein
MNESTQKMLEALAHDEMDAFAENFDLALKEKASFYLDDMSKSVSKNLFYEEKVDEDYGRTGINTGIYKFEDENNAKKFFESAINSGITKKDLSLQGSNVHVGDIADADMEETLYELAKQMNATFTEENDSFVSVMSAVLSEGNDIIISIEDNSRIKLTPGVVKTITNLHDSLNNENQKILRKTIFESRSSFERISKFAKEYLKGN